MARGYRHGGTGGSEQKGVIVNGSTGSINAGGRKTYNLGIATKNQIIGEFNVIFGNLSSSYIANSFITVNGVDTLCIPSGSSGNLKGTFNVYANKGDSISFTIVNGASSSSGISISSGTYEFEI